MKLTRLLLVAASAVVALCPACYRTQRKPLRLQWPTMGTVAAVQCADHASAARAREICEASF
ncbi:MAG: hypothetical protein PHU80_05130, partial [Kiritimatiellae bacterium]|nr:hypothetical protein [Kiritimatiellia bacterium]